jgi:ABC-type Na+ efflux pump permease subunit
MQWYTRNVANEDLKKALTEALREVLRPDRYVWFGVAPEMLVAIQAPVVDERDIDLSGRTSGEERSREAATFIPMIFVYALIIGISAQSQTLLTSTIEEKSNRLVEVLLSSVSPWDLMAGKILGLVAATLTLMGIWTAGGAFFVHRQGWEALVRDEVFAWFLVYLVAAIVFYSTFIAAIGSAVTEIKEANNLMVPVWVVIMIPAFLMFFVGRHPDLLWVRLLSYVPFFTPFLMVNRIASVVPPGPVELAASLVLMAASCWGATWLAARVFRVGILLYGKAATPRELWRWLRAG